MGAGYYISGIGHAALIFWVMVGGFLDQNHIPDIEATDVSLITEEQFAALSLPDAGVDAVVPSPTVSTPAEDLSPELPLTLPESALDQTAPPPVAEVEAEVIPATPSKPEPVFTEPAPRIEPLAEPETPDAGVDLTRVTPTRARRIATRPSLGFPGIDTAPAIQRERIAPIEEAPPEPERQPEPEEPPARVEETTTEIVTEAEEETSELAPTKTPRPKSRPVRVAEAEPEVEPEAEPEPDPEPEPEQDPDAEAEAQALAEARAEADRAAAAAAQAAADAAAEAELAAQAAADAQAEADAAASTGPPLSAGEKDALRVAVEKCWNVGSLSTEALRVTVVVGVTFSLDGRPETNSINMVSAEGGSDSAARQAYEAGRRAIIRCGASGYELPVEKYAEWRSTEFVFNPENMRIK